MKLYEVMHRAANNEPQYTVVNAANKPAAIRGAQKMFDSEGLRL